jgi:hypothetical protein
MPNRHTLYALTTPVSEAHYYCWWVSYFLLRIRTTLSRSEQPSFFTQQDIGGDYTDSINSLDSNCSTGPKRKSVYLVLVSCYEELKWGLDVWDFRNNWLKERRLRQALLAERVSMVLRTTRRVRRSQETK